MGRVMEEEMGLAAAMGGTAPQAAPAQQQQMISVQELAAMLKQGVTPEELAQAGVPEELINQAMMAVQAEMQAGQPAQVSAQGQGGLADMYAAEGM